MSTALNQVDIRLEDGNGVWRATLRIFSTKEGSICKVPLDEVERFSEAEVQLMEGAGYEYELSGAPHGAILESRGESVVVERSSNPALPLCGTIQTGGYVGRLPLFLWCPGMAEPIRCAVEVRSKKLGYRDDLRQMLAEVTNCIVALALDHRSPTEIRLRPDPSKTASSLYQQYAFLAGLLESSQFQDALNQIILRPHSLLRSDPHRHYVGQIRRLDPHTLRQIGGGATRVKVPSSHPLSAGLPSLAEHVRGTRRESSRDTQENQFVRFVLEQFSFFLAETRRILQEGVREESRRLLLEVEQLLKKLGGYLGHPVLSGASRLARVPRESTVLQRQAGYREILEAWLRFDACATLTWEGAEDVFGAGQQNTAVLYEYWAFFKLLELVRSFCDLPPVETAKLFTRTGAGFSVALRRGKNLALVGSAVVDGVGVNVRFDYNRSFRWTADVRVPSSWTRTLRPDYTVSVWRAGLTEAAAEASGTIAHLHFDAKYRLDFFDSVFKAEDPEQSSSQSEAEPLSASSAKAADLMKMHAYRDAIRRSVGAFVLYPGTTSMHWTGYHELLPGLGAFVLRPSGGDLALREFLNEFVRHYVAGSTRDQLAAYTAVAYGASSGSAKRWSS